MDRFREFRLVMSATAPTLLFILVVTLPLGCGKKPDRSAGPATRSITGIVTEVESHDYYGYVKLTFKDGTKITLHDKGNHIVFVNTPIRIGYNDKKYIKSVSRLHPPEKDATVIIDHSGPNNPFFTPPATVNKQVSIQVDRQSKVPWSVDSTMEEVRRIEGEPTLVTGHNPVVRWYYYDPDNMEHINEQSFIEFNTKGRVVFHKLGEHEFIRFKEKDL